MTTTTWAQPSLFDANGTDPVPSHRDDNWTSRAAARAVALTVGTARYRVLAELGTVDTAYRGGRTAHELAARLDMLATTAGTRLGELVAAGYARPTGERRPTDTGALAALHIITDTGRDALRTATLARPELADAARTAPQPANAPGRTIHRTPSRYGLTRVRDRVIEELCHGGNLGRTAVELAERIGALRTAVGTELTHLAAAGLVERLDRTRLTDRGRAAAIYRLTAAGVAEYRRLTTARE